MESVVVSDRMLFSNLSYIFYNQDIKMYTPSAPNSKKRHHFQISNPLPANYKNNFIFLGYVDQLKYLENKYEVRLLETKSVSFVSEPVQVYEITF